MCLYVLSSVLLISLVFFVLSCYVSQKNKRNEEHGTQNIKTNNKTTQKNKRNEQHGTQNIKIHNLYDLSSVLLISFVFFALSCYVSLCSEFRIAHFIIFFVLSCYLSDKDS
jgi:hypothetical protein